MMNPELLYALAGSRAREIRDEAARSRTRAHQARSRPARPGGRWSAWRRRTGFALVEAGLQLLATTRPEPRQ